jgi:hypothetical protein
MTVWFQLLTPLSDDLAHRFMEDFS